MKARVLRPFAGEHGRPLETGQVTDVTHWRPQNVESLIRRRYLKEVIDLDDLTPKVRGKPGDK